MRTTYVAHITLDSGDTDAQELMPEVEAVVRIAVQLRLRDLQHRLAGHDAPVEVVVVEAVEADDVIQRMNAAVGELLAASQRRARQTQVRP